MGNTALIAMQGRVHFYEGYDIQQVTFAVRVLKAIGVETLVLTNAAGGLNPAYRPGDLMGINDHIFFPGFAGFNPLRGPNDDELGPRFPAMLKAYDAQLLQKTAEIAVEQNIKFHQGTYIMLAGPNFETRSEMEVFAANWRRCGWKRPPSLKPLWQYTAVCAYSAFPPSPTLPQGKAMPRPIIRRFCRSDGKLAHALPASLNR